VAGKIALQFSKTGVEGGHLEVIRRCTEAANKRGKRTGVKRKTCTDDQAGPSAARGLLDEICIEDAQDFSLAELNGLLSLCCNREGVVVAGDTCQTINPESAFSL